MGWKIILLFTAGFASTMVSAAEPTAVYFRSDTGHGMGGGTLPDRLDPDVFQRWRCSLAPGHSTPCLWGDRLFLTTFDGATEQLSTVAIDRTTGQVLWQQAAPRRDIEPYHQAGSPAAASPACDGERVYAFFGSYGVLTYDLDGNPGWSRSLGPFQDEYGSASSPIVVEDLLLLNEDHDTNNALFALNKRTGETVWQVPRNEFTRSYSTPMVVHVGGQPQVVVAGSLTLTGYDLRTGDRCWWLHGLARIVNTTPVVHGDTLYVATWSPGGDTGERITMEDWEAAARQYDTDRDGKIRRDELSAGPVQDRFYRIDLNQDQGIDASEWNKQAEVFKRAQNSVFALRLGGSGELGVERVKWSYAKGVPYVASPLYHDGVVFMVKDSGVLTSLDAESGHVIKQGRLSGRGNYYASPVISDGKLYLASERGVMTVVSAQGDWQILDSRDFGESIYATPVVHDGRLYVRTAAAVYCLAVPGA